MMGRSSETGGPAWSRDAAARRAADQLTSSPCRDQRRLLASRAGQVPPQNPLRWRTPSSFPMISMTAIVLFSTHVWTPIADRSCHKSPACRHTIITPSEVVALCLTKLRFLFNMPLVWQCLKRTYRSRKASGSQASAICAREFSLRLERSSWFHKMSQPVRLQAIRDNF
jgi:hypothetical protein